MPSFTLDTNCLIAVDENRPEAGDVRTLANAHAQRRADVAVVAMSASEKQQGKRYIQDFAEFQARLANLGLAHLKMLEPMCYFDITFHDYCLWSGDDMLTQEKQVHNILFPDVEFEWNDFCRANGLDPSQSPSGRWRNGKCDVQNMWTHIYNKRDVLVTSDMHFHGATKKPALIALGTNRIEYPGDAVTLI